MKAEALHTLIVARVLFDQLASLTVSEDKYVASAALTIAQDAMELVIVGALLELEVDQRSSLENLSFSKLLSKLKQENISVPKTGTLKALHKQRNLVKHHGQVGEPETIRNYVSAARMAADALLRQVVNDDLLGIAAHQFLKDGEAKEFIREAESLIESKNFFQALVQIRKALFVEIEVEYVIEDWTKTEENPPGFLDFLRKEGMKAPWYTKSPEWIRNNVRDPFDYIQLDHEQIRLDLLEWGASTQDFWNLWRLTPPVFRSKYSQKWMVKRAIKHIKTGATEENARYCLDRAVSLLERKQKHFDLSQWLHESSPNQLRVRAKENANVFKKADRNSEIEGKLQKGEIYGAASVVPGLYAEGEWFVRITHLQEEEPKFLSGYSLLSVFEIINEQ